jgi:hypothetical protein
MLRKSSLIQAAFGLLIVCLPMPSPAASAPNGGEPEGLEETEERLADTELADLRGGEAIVLANQTMSSITAGSSIGGDVSGGAVSLSDSALSSFNGFGNIVINTGSQVTLQSGMNVTINVSQ